MDILNNYNSKYISIISEFQERREKFQDELAEYAVQLEEFQTLGDVGEIHEYLRRARALHTRLDHAANYVDQINKEEEALSWNTTHYPLRKQVCPDIHFLEFKSLSCPMQ